MILSSRIWEELGPLAVVVDLVDHDTGAIGYKQGTSAEDIAAVQAIVAAHDPALADSATLERQKYETDAAAANAYGKLTALKNMTPAEARQWIDDNVNTLADVKDAIGTLATAVILNARRL